MNKHILTRDEDTMTGNSFHNHYLYSHFEGLNFYMCTIENCSFEGAVFTDCNFDSVIFSLCHFYDCTFNNCTFGRTNFKECVISGTELTSLTGDFSVKKSSFHNNTLKKCEETQIYFEESEIESCDFINATSIRAYEVKLKDCIGINYAECKINGVLFMINNFNDSYHFHAFNRTRKYTERELLNSGEIDIEVIKKAIAFLKDAVGITY